MNCSLIFRGQLNYPFQLIFSFAGCASYGSFNVSSVCVLITHCIRIYNSLWKMQTQHCVQKWDRDFPFLLFFYYIIHEVEKNRWKKITFFITCPLSASKPGKWSIGNNIVFYLDTVMENKTKACVWTVTPFNANQCCLEHAFQCAVSCSHTNQKRVEISRGLRPPCSINRHTTALKQTFTVGGKSRYIWDSSRFSL